MCVTRRSTWGPASCRETGSLLRGRPWGRAVPAAPTHTQNQTQSSNHGSLEGRQRPGQKRESTRLGERRVCVCFMERSCRLFSEQLEVRLLPHFPGEKQFLCPREEAPC